VNSASGSDNIPVTLRLPLQQVSELDHLVLTLYSRELVGTSLGKISPHLFVEATNTLVWLPAHTAQHSHTKLQHRVNVSIIEYIKQKFI
jgi:hypothetical protein